MRPVLHTDITAVAKTLLSIPENLRAERFYRMLVQAEAADAYRKRFGRWHPVWGNGSLLAAAAPATAGAEPFLDDPEYCGCLAMIFEALVQWRCEKAHLNRKHKTDRGELSDPAPIA